MKAADFKKLPVSEEEHFYRCAKCRQYVDKRELRDVIFHESDHNRQILALPRIVGKPIRKHLSRRSGSHVESFFDCRTANDPAIIHGLIAHLMTQKPKPQRPPRFSGVTKGIRLRLDQMDALEKIFAVEPELDWSKAVRRGIDLFLAEYRQRQPKY